MSEITAVPLRPVAKGTLTKLWLGVGVAVVIGVGVAWAGTSKQVAMGQPPTVFLAKNAKKHGVVTTPSGLEYQVLAPGAGAHPGPQDIVQIEYDGKLLDGSTFDSTAQHGQPAVMPVAGSIPGFSEGLQLMQRGARYRFWIPPQLAYGDQGAGDGVIPPNSVLQFDVTLREIAPQQPGYGAAGMAAPGGAAGAAN
ncbi:FKBP-type peptidyl-prolyl cis-trans isomerase [uncultured Sphingomonas sp.]|jgi:FKBP-type peptidyl-prolyl cis-trans isomerase FkpA|uniref:FKBP-type peptidyl-prolyl cis-trans isomerase n=1 Tax=uncultured Sphingomonas sp. TaxID=158754 RepID=UPI00261C4421|nr:FKBP-type peptidyl-prolyl cis-trans isomerase [uncultured Sphingomonas sp.]